MNQDVNKVTQAVFSRAETAFNRLFEITEFFDRTLSLETLRLGDSGQVRGGLIQALANPFILNRSTALKGNPLLMHDIVIVTPVVRHDDEEWKAKTRGCPKRGYTHQKISVAQNGNRHTARTL